MRGVAALLPSLLVALPCPAAASDAGIARPELLLNELVDGMPKGERQEIKVLIVPLCRPA